MLKVDGSQLYVMQFLFSWGTGAGKKCIWMGRGNGWQLRTSSLERLVVRAQKYLEAFFLTAGLLPPVTL